MTDPKNILIIKTSSLGDIVHCLFAPRMLKAAWPQARITWLVNNNYRDLLEHHPDIDHLIFFNRDGWKKSGDILTNLARLRVLIEDLRSQHFDLVVDLQGQLRSAFFGFISGAPLRYGIANTKELAWMFYNRRIPAHSLHSVDKALELVRTLTRREEAPIFPIRLTEAEIREAEALLRNNVVPAGDRIVIVCPGARWNNKRWPAERFTELIGRLLEARLTVLMCGAKEDFELAKTITSPIADSGRVFNLCGKTSIRGLCALIARAALVVTNDSGPMHLAAALGIPLVALFGPTDPRLTGPYTSNSRVLHSNVECSPCLSRHCSQKEKIKCLQRIPAETVFRAAAEMLGLPPRTQSLITGK